ncbi:MAG: signal peptidase I [Clostridiales bacterium]|nr:signal peptidase I [Clostridiales bacterium]
MNFDLDRDKKRSRQKKIIAKIAIWVIEIAAVIGLAYFIINFALEKTTMLGNSMDVTLQADNKIIINKLAYKFGKPKRYDVIVFKQSGKEHSYYNIKRVIGLPGETVLIKDGVVYINDEVLEEPMITEPIQIPGLAEDKITLEEDEYFVLGDNRNNSEDSRFANIANVVRKDIIGKAWLRLKPFDFVNKINMYDKAAVEKSASEEQAKEKKVKESE